MHDEPPYDDTRFAQQSKRCSENARNIDLGVSSSHPLTHERWTRCLSDGRVIELRHLLQFGTYDGMLCGLPGQYSDEVAQCGEAALRHAHEHLPPAQGSPVLLTPQRFCGQVTRRDRPHEPWHRVGFVTTIAEFQSATVARDERECYSSLVAVWFQDAYGLPTEPWVLAQIDALEWNRLAWDWTP